MPIYVYGHKAESSVTKGAKKVGTKLTWKLHENSSIKQIRNKRKKQKLSIIRSRSKKAKMPTKSDNT